MFLSSFVFHGFCHFLAMILFLFGFCFRFRFCHVFKLRSFNSQLHFALKVVGYHAFGRDIGKNCKLTEPMRSQDPQDTARSRSKKKINLNY